MAKCTVERLMQAMGLAGIRRGKKTITTVSNPKAPCPLDKVNREFRVSRPNALWVVIGNRFGHFVLLRWRVKVGWRRPLLQFWP